MIEVSPLGGEAVPTSSNSIVKYLILAVLLFYMPLASAGAGMGVCAACSWNKPANSAPTQSGPSTDRGISGSAPGTSQDDENTQGQQFGVVNGGDCLVAAAHKDRTTCKSAACTGSESCKALDASLNNQNFQEGEHTTGVHDGAVSAAGDDGGGATLPPIIAAPAAPRAAARPQAAGADSPASGANGGGGASPSGGAKGGGSKSEGCSKSEAAKASDPSGSNNSSGPDSPSGSDSVADENSCSNLQTDAVKCCMDPTSCGATDGSNTGGTGSGVTGTCNKANTSMNSYSDGTLNAGTACLKKYLNCETTCNSLAKNYTDNQDVYSYLKAKAKSCTSLAPQAAAAGKNASSGYSAANAGQNCDNLASAMPQSTDSNSSNSTNNPASAASSQSANNDPYGCQSNPSSVACQNCQINPNAASCKAMAEASQVAKGTAGYLSTNNSSMDKPSGFNVGNPGDGITPQRNFGSDGKAMSNQASAIPNNTGGGIPGGGGGRGLGSGGGGSAAAGAMARAASLDPAANIEQGLRGGGGYQAPGDGGFESGGGFSGYGGRGPAGDNSKMDLKNFLPGGARDPNRRAGGLTGALNPEISGRSSDIFKNITNRFQEKCRLGELIDCR